MKTISFHQSTINICGVGRGVLLVLDHPPTYQRYLLFSEVFVVSSPFNLDLGKD